MLIFNVYFEAYKASYLPHTLEGDEDNSRQKVYALFVPSCIQFKCLFTIGYIVDESI